MKDDKMLGTNKVKRVGATPSARTTHILVAREVDQGAYSLSPNAAMLLKIAPPVGVYIVMVY